MMNKILITLFFTLCSWQVTLSCSCMPLGPLTIKDFNEQYAIFIGKAKNIKVVKNADSYEQYEITFLVTTAFKGVRAQQEVKVFTNTSSAACGLNVMKEQTWLLYASLFKGVLSTNMCSRSTPRMKTQELNLLKTFAAGKGSVWKDGGRLQGEGRFVNQVPEGKWKYYYPNGDLAEEGYYLKGKMNGEWVEYINIDQLEAQMKSSGTLRKNASLFREPLKLRIASISHYDKGELSGAYIEYDRQYHVQRLINYFKGKEQGLCITYYPSGLIEQEQRFSNGELNGVWRGYYDHGGLMYEGKYEKGNAGIFKVYDDKGVFLGDSAGPPYYDVESKKMELMKN